MPAIRIPDAHRGKVWRALVACGPIGRISQEPIYLISDRQLRMLRRKSFLLNWSLRPMDAGQGRNMAKAARRYDLYLLLMDNEGRPFAQELFDSIERRLVAQFGGLTTQQRDFPLRGVWQGDSRTYVDWVIILTVLDFRRQGSTRFISQLKQDLLRAFDQLEILITEQSLRVH